jgi:tetratricopeptide (TPR) repeat protein
VEEEADLHRRVGMLEEVLKLYPGEPHFERALKLVRDKRDLVNSIVAKARFFEERGQFNEALDQWEILRSIYDRYPGLAFEIERLMKKRDQQARENSKAMWVQQTDRWLEAGDYERALRSVEAALAEFPGEPDLLELGKVARKGCERAAEALQLLARARELSEQGGLEASLEPLRHAAQLDPRNTVIRTVLLNSLLDDARRQMQKPDWDSALARLKELLALDPSHAGAQSLASQISDRKHEEFVTVCITEARRLQAEGDLARAIAVVAEGLRAYPNDPRFEQLLATLQRAQVEARRQTTPAKAADVATGPAATPVPQAPAPATQAPAAPSATAILASAPTVSLPAAAATPAAPRTPAPPPAKKPGAKSLPFRSKYLLIATAGLAGVVLVVVAIAAVGRLAHRPAPPVAPASYQVVLKTTPEGAAISVNGSPCGSSTCTMKLAPGHYQAEATLIGYQDTTTPFDVAANGGPGEVSLILQPTPAQIHLATDLTEGTLLVDGTPAGQLQGDATQVPNLSPGEHKLDIQSGNAKASLSISYSPSALPKLTQPIQAQGIDAVVISRYGSEAMVYCSTLGVPVTVDGKAQGAAGATGVELKDLAPGPHEVQMTINGLARKIPFESSATSGIVASLLTERNVGSLRILTGEDGVTVYLNGQKSARPTSGGSLLLSLTPSHYIVRVEKPGLVAADQSVDVLRGQERQLIFKLVSARATLEVRGVPPGTEVWLDGAQIGTSNDSGFSWGNIEPGKHTVALQKDRARMSPAEYVFEAGKTTTVEGAKLSATGTLRIEVSPPIEGLQVRLQAEGDAREQVVTGNEVSLPEGTYRVTGSAPQYQEAVTTVHVAAGAVAAATLVMKRPEVASTQPKPQAAFSMEDWVKAAAATPSLSKWEREGQVWVKRGGEFVVAPFNPTPGTLIFTALLMKGKHLEWVVDYKDDRNYVLFQIEERSLVRTEYVNGKKGEPVRKPLSTSATSYVTVMIKVTASSIVHSVLVQKNWEVVDDWARPGGGLQGKVGFYVHGKDQIGVSQFTFAAN